MFTVLNMCLRIYALTCLPYYILYTVMWKTVYTEKQAPPSHIPVPFPLSPTYIHAFVTFRLYHTVIMQTASLKVTQ